MEVNLKRLRKNGAFDDEVLVLTKKKGYSFGRRSQNDVVLFAPTVSKHHCIFHHNSEGLFVEVLESLAGVVVNGIKYCTGSMVRLHNKDLVMIGLMFKYQVEIKPIVQDFDIKTNFTSDYETDYERIKTEDLSHVNIKNELELEDATAEIEDVDCEENWRSRRRVETFKSEVSREIKEQVTLEKETQEMSLHEIHSSMQITIDEEEFKPLYSLNSTGEALTDPKTIDEISRVPKILKLSEFPNFVTEETLYLVFENPKEKEISLKENESESVNKFDTYFVQHGINSVKNLPTEFSSSETTPEINFSSYEKRKTLESLKPKIPEEIECSPFARKMKKFEKEKRLPEKRLLVTLIDILKNPISDFPSMTKLPSDLGNLNEKPKPTKNGRKSHEEKVFKCKFCAKQLSSKRYRIIHEKMHITKRPHRCKKCGKDFTKSSRLKRHWETHNELRLFSCAICEMTFKTKEDVKHHMAIHSGVNLQTCEICKKTLSRKTSLERHMKTHDSTLHVGQDNTRKAIHECKECYRIFRFRCELEEHIRSHKGERPFVCQVCEKTFPGKKALWNHKRWHVVKLTCNECQEMLPNKTQLKLHLMIHFPQKGYNCPDCLYVASQPSKLARHYQLHTGEKPFQCLDCGKAFSRKGNLTVHMAHHTGDYPYQCKKCGKGYTDSSKLRKHYIFHMISRDKK